MSYLQDQRPLSIADLARMCASGEKIAVLTAYDASFASLCDAAGIDVLLVGDSLGNVLQGHGSTLPVTLEHMAYHTACVARGARRAFIVSDLPFGSYHESPAQAMGSAARLMASGAHMVKLEGGLCMADTVRFLVERGVPVCAHIGLLPQAVHQLGGYRVQGKTDESAARLRAEARALSDAGATLMVMEMVPAALAGEITAAIPTPTIGIGAGKDTSGQVLVLHDMLGVFPGKKARFVRNFMEGAASIQDAVARYVEAVKSGSFPGTEHAY